MPKSLGCLVVTLIFGVVRHPAMAQATESGTAAADVFGIRSSSRAVFHGHHRRSGKDVWDAVKRARGTALCCPTETS